MHTTHADAYVPTNMSGIPLRNESYFTFYLDVRDGIQTVYMPAASLLGNRRSTGMQHDNCSPASVQSWDQPEKKE